MQTFNQTRAGLAEALGQLRVNDQANINEARLKLELLEADLAVLAQGKAPWWAEETCPHCDDPVGRHQCPSKAPGEIKISIQRCGEIAEIDIVGSAGKILDRLEKALRA